MKSVFLSFQESFRFIIPKTLARNCIGLGVIAAEVFNSTRKIGLLNFADPGE